MSTEEQDLARVKSLQQHWAKVRSVKAVHDPDPARKGLDTITDHEEWLRAQVEVKRSNVRALYERHRPDRYANASYGTLTGEQDPGGKVARWLDSGPRALILAGRSRVGKTQAAYAIGNEANQAGLWVYGRTAADLSAALKPDGDQYAYDRAVGCDLLLVDDLGRERTTEWWTEQFHRIIDDRCGNKRRLIVTLNAPPDPEKAFQELAERYGHPVAERLIDGGAILAIDGPAVRHVVEEW